VIRFQWQRSRVLDDLEHMVVASIVMRAAAVG
jgi:hypothetical protein